MLNAIFVGDATLAGQGTDVIPGTAAQPFDTIPLSFAPDSRTPTLLDVFNGALTVFSDAYNVELYSLLNPDVAFNAIPLDDLFGSSTTIAAALGESTAWQPPATSSRLAWPTWLGCSSKSSAPKRTRRHVGGFVLAGPSRDCAAAPFARYPGSA